LSARGRGGPVAPAGAATAPRTAAASSRVRISLIASILMETNKPSTTELAVLGLIAFGPSSGYDLSRTAARSIGHMWSPSRSQIYKVLPRLVAAGLARSREVEQQGRPDKAVYRITPAGRTALRRWIEEVEPDPPGGTGIFLLKIFLGW